MATTVLRKGRAERTGRTILRSSENAYMGANYRTGSSSGGSGTVSAGDGPPSGSAPEGSKYTNKLTGQEYTYYNGTWN